MRTMRVILLVCILLTGCASGDHFHVIRHTQGVDVWSNGKEVVQVVSLTKGATVHIRLAPHVQSGSTMVFQRQSIQDAYATFQSEDAHAFSLGNSQFFDDGNASQALLAFSLKANGAVYEGYGDKREYVGKKKLLMISAQQATMVPYKDDVDALRRSKAANEIVGLAPDAPTSDDQPVGRTYIGVNQSGGIILFQSELSTRAHAVAVLRAFHVKDDHMMLLDGGPSSQVIVEGRQLIPRPSPQKFLSPLPAFISVSVSR